MKSKFKIKHPGTGKSIICDNFITAMKYFEGFNLPYKILKSGKCENFKAAHKRVKKYLSGQET